MKSYALSDWTIFQGVMNTYQIVLKTSKRITEQWNVGQSDLN